MNDDPMNDQPIDFSSLDPTRDSARLEALAGAIARDAMAARAHRSTRSSDFLSELTAWTRPALAAAAIVLAVAISMLVITRAPATRAVANATDVLGIPPELMDLVHSPRTPSLTQIDEALASAGRAGQ
jgi:hypothetical protein